MKIILSLILLMYLFSCKQNDLKTPKGYEFEYNKDGHLISFYSKKDTMKDGPYFEFFESRNIKYYADFKEGEIKGTFLELDTSGTIRAVCNSGKILKVCTDYYLNGSIKTSGGFYNQKKFGQFNFFDSTGNLTKTINYYNDTMNGSVFNFNNNKISKYYLVNNGEVIYSSEYNGFTLTREDIKSSYFFTIDTVLNKDAILFYYINPPHRKIKIYQKQNNNWKRLYSLDNPLIIPYKDISNVNLSLKVVAIYNNDSIENEVNFISEDIYKFHDSL